MIKLYAAIFAAIAGPAHALICEYPEVEDGLYQAFQVLGSGQYDRAGIFKVGIPSVSDQMIELYYTCHQQFDGAITCLREMDDNSTEAITILAARTLAVHATLGGLYPMKSEVSVKNVICDE